MSKRNHWYDYLWVLTALYLALGFFNILFAWDCCAFSFRLSWLLHSALNHIAINTAAAGSYSSWSATVGSFHQNAISPPGCAHIPSVMASCCFLQRCLSICWFLPTWSLPMLSIFIRQSACCGLLTYHGTGLTAAVRSHGSRNLLLDFTASCWPPAFSVSSRCCCSSRVPGAFIALWAR